MTDEFNVGDAGLGDSVPPDRERGDFLGDDLSGIHTCHAGCPCQRATGESRCPECGLKGLHRCPGWPPLAFMGKSATEPSRNGPSVSSDRATGEDDKARKCEMCDGTGHVWDGPEGDQTYVGICSCRAIAFPNKCPGCRKPAGPFGPVWHDPDCPNRATPSSPAPAGYPYEAERQAIAAEKALAPQPQKAVAASHTGPISSPALPDARIPDEVIEEAEAAADGELYDRGFGSPDGPLPAMGPFIRNMAARFVVEAAAPIIARHAAQAEREVWQAKIERQRILAYDAYRDCEVQWDREKEAGEPHEKVNEERMQVLDDTCGMLWGLLNDPDAEDGEPDDRDVEAVIGAEKRGAQAERDRVTEAIEHEFANARTGKTPGDVESYINEKGGQE